MKRFKTVIDLPKRAYSVETETREAIRRKVIAIAAIIAALLVFDLSRGIVRFTGRALSRPARRAVIFLVETGRGLSNRLLIYCLPAAAPV